MPDAACLPLDELSTGQEVFLDANVFIYAACVKSAQCMRMLRRCAREELYGVTTFEVLNEVTHRLMLAEALSTGIVTRESAASLARHPEGIRGLSTYWNQVERILQLNLIIVPADEARMRAANAIRAAYGLLTNDSMVVAAMEERGLIALASADTDFDRVFGLIRYAPFDL
ncbi:MAG: type II toxin-antitoxin system VapC family toxin [Armatimonadota bacterium]|nr:type II toxin-antitoxin system VapC family toxin [Armatimonadota bacterium]